MDEGKNRNGDGVMLDMARRLFKEEGYFTILEERLGIQTGGNIAFMANDRRVVLLQVIKSVSELQCAIYEGQGLAQQMTRRLRRGIRMPELSVVIFIEFEPDDEAFSSLEAARKNERYNRTYVIVIKPQSDQIRKEEEIRRGLAPLFSPDTRIAPPPPDPLETLERILTSEKTKKLVRLFSREGEDGILRSLEADEHEN